MWTNNDRYVSFACKKNQLHCLEEVQQTKYHILGQANVINFFLWKKIHIYVYIQRGKEELFEKVWGLLDLFVKGVELADEEEVWVLVNANLLMRLMRVTFKQDWLDNNWLNHLCNIRVLLSERFILLNFLSSFLPLYLLFIYLISLFVFWLRIVCLKCCVCRLCLSGVDVHFCEFVTVHTCFENMLMNISLKSGLQHFNSHNKISDISQPLNIKHMEVKTFKALLP